MQDKQGRTIDYIRISVTDRCNLRCTYCMPEEGVMPVFHEDILTYDEIVRVCALFSQIGIRKIKLTGGEPLVRRKLSQLVRMLYENSGIEQVTITTNGVLLAEQIEELVQAGIQGINISLDTLEPRLYQQITRRNEFHRAWQGFQAALCYAHIPVKINCVLLGLPNQDLMEIAALARDYEVSVRFIEMMPLGMERELNGIPVSQREVEKQLEKVYGNLQMLDDFHEGNGPAVYYRLPGFKGRIGFISALSHKFCNSCNRIRLTSQGFLKTCLQYETGCDMRQLLRKGADDTQLLETMRSSIWEKPAGHQFMEKNIQNEEIRNMSQIGG